MRLFVIRHGQTDWNIVRRIQGSTDIPLNETGVRQANDLVASMKENGTVPAAVYTSPYRRAKMTAEIVGQAFGVPVRPEDAFREMSFGRWEGRTWDDITENDRAAFEAWEKDRAAVPTPGGESYLGLAARLIPAVKRLLEEEKEDVAIVTHGAVIMALIVIYESVSFGRIDQVMRNIGNSSVTVFEGEILRERLNRFEKNHSDGAKAQNDKKQEGKAK